MIEEKIKFLADENCDFIVVRVLRSSGYDALSVAESYPAISDSEVLRLAVNEKRILLTEDKDFGEWVFSHNEATYGVVLIRYQASIRSSLADGAMALVTDHAYEPVNAFTVLEPGRARVRKIV